MFSTTLLRFFVRLDKADYNDFVAQVSDVTHEPNLIIVLGQIFI